MKLNALIVDDDPVFRTVLKELVNKEKRIRLAGIAKSGEEAKKLFKKHNVDLVFLDLGLPGMNGFEFIESIENPEALQIILITGYKEHALDAFAYDVADYLVKPITRERFEKAVTRALRNRGKNPQAASNESIFLKKTVEFMQSRDISTLEPVPMRSAKLGFAYPMLTANFDYQREYKTLDILEEAENEGLLTGEFVDNVYVCNTCYNSQLHFRESCPNCRSTNLKAEDLVHHFSCAYMGPISDFYKKSTDDSNMVCPKCEKMLNHIGVDYDKPSIIYNCNRCDHSFQNAEVKGKCHDCGADTRAEHLVKKTIKKYQLTQTGVEVARGKFEPRLQGFGVLDDIMDESYFLRFLGKSIQRKKNSDEESCLAEMRFNNIPELYERIGETRTGELVRELYQIMTKELSETDEVFFPNKMKAQLLISDKNFRQSKKLLKELAETLHNLLRDNFRDFDADISMRVQQVGIKKSAKEQLNILNKETVTQQ